MNYMKIYRQFKLPALALAAFALVAVPSFAQVNLAAVPAEWTPPGSGAPIVMWAFVADTGACPEAAVAWSPGPEMTASPGGTLTVSLRNCLADPVSVFIPGQLKATIPVTFLDGQGRSRVRSFDAETAPGGVGSYIWTGVKEGTYLYHSGTHPQVQVQMGLYGAFSVGNYGIANEATLVYSEIDPALHAAVADGSYGTTGPTSTFDYKPRYFLINGEVFPNTTNVSVDTITDVLLRFVNAGLTTHVPSLEGGLYMSLIAEDGNPYPFPLEQYGIELQAAKTIDAVVNVGTPGTYALYDRAMALTNWGETGGGMLTYIVAGAAENAPLAVADTYATDENIPLIGALSVLANDEDGLGGGSGSIPGTYEASLVSDASNGDLTLYSDGSFDYSPDPDFNGGDFFTYQAVDTTTPGPNSNVVTVNITVAPVNNYGPVANPVSASTLPNVPVFIDATANDTDADGNLDPSSANTTCAGGSLGCSGPENGTLTNHGDGTFTYDPLGFTGDDSFVYEVCDTGDDGLGLNALCDTATVSISINNTAPVANPDSATTSGNTLVVINVVENDTDDDGNLDPASVEVLLGSEPLNGSAIANIDGAGTVRYTPDTGFTGEDSFVYEVCDAFAACDTATVTITVTNNPPVANDDFAQTQRNTTVTFSVTDNDNDADGTIDDATVDLDPDTEGRQITVITQRGGTATVDITGIVTFDPKRGSRGTDLFTYTVRDNLDEISNEATVRVNVVK
jgi:FtsP/CotA-like multicopper oxidase with cupredoxin domain